MPRPRGRSPATANVLSERGLRMRPRANRPAGPISANYLARVLRDRYYLGFVSYNGEEYHGTA